MAIILISVSFFLNTHDDFTQPFICVMIEIFSQRLIKNYLAKGNYEYKETIEITNFYSVFMVLFFFLFQVIFYYFVYI